MVVNLMVVEVILVVVGIEGSEIYPLTTAIHETWTSKGSHWSQAMWQGDKGQCDKCLMLCCSLLITVGPQR